MYIDLFADPKLLQNPIQKNIVLISHEMMVIKKLLNELKKTGVNRTQAPRLDQKRLQVLQMINARLGHNGRALETLKPPELKQKILPLAAYLLTFSPRIRSEQEKSFVFRNPKLLYFLWQKIPDEAIPLSEKFGDFSRPSAAGVAEGTLKTFPSRAQTGTVRESPRPPAAEQAPETRHRPLFWYFVFAIFIMLFIGYFLFNTATITAASYTSAGGMQSLPPPKEDGATAQNSGFREERQPVKPKEESGLENPNGRPGPENETVAGLYLREPRVNFQNKLVLTFDDIEVRTDVDAILSVLKKYKIKAVFFIEASELVDGHEQPRPGAQDLLHKILAHGHTIGNHSFGHPYFGKMRTPLAIAQNLQKAETVIDAVLGFHYNIAFVRPPYGNRGKNSCLDSVLKQMNRQLILWEIDTYDWQMNLRYSDGRHLSPEEVIDKTLYNIKNSTGGVILMHAFPHLTAVLEPIITKALALTNTRGRFSFVAIEDLLSIKYGKNKP